MGLEQLGGRRGLVVELGDPAVALRVVVHGVDDDLAAQRVGRDGLVGAQRDRHDDDITCLCGLPRGGGASVWPELGDEVGQRLRPAAVTQHHVVPGSHRQPSHGAADVPAADESPGRHGRDNAAGRCDIVPPVTGRTRRVSPRSRPGPAERHTWRDPQGSGSCAEAPTTNWIPAKRASTRAAISSNSGRAWVADDEHESAASVRTLAAEYETLAAIAPAPRWAAALTGAGLSEAAVAEVEASPAYGALSTALRRADAHQLPVEATLPRLAADVMAGSRDPAAVLHARVEAWTAAAIRTGRAAPLDVVVGLLPAVRLVSSSAPDVELGSGLGGRGPVEVPADLAEALHVRHVLMEQRVDELLDRAARADAPWLAALGPWPTNQQAAMRGRPRSGLSPPTAIATA